MIAELLKIRFKQTYRGIRGIGWIRIVFMLGLIGFLGFVLYVKSAEEIASQYISIGFVLLILLIHLKRGDKLFLKSHFSNHKTLMLSEYLFLSLPLLFLFVLHKQWVALAELAPLLLVVHVDFKTRNSSINTRLQKLIPDDAFEWKAGIRKQLFILVPVWIVAALTAFFVASVPAAILVIGVSCLSYFEKCESQQILMSYELSSHKFILLKIKRQLQLFSILALPLIVLFLPFNIDKWYIPVAEYVVFCMLHIYVITTKYAFYEPNGKSPAAQIFVGIGAVGAIIPIFLPVVWLLTIWFYNKSVSNLNFFLDDYN